MYKMEDFFQWVLFLGGAFCNKKCLTLTVASFLPDNRLYIEWSTFSNRIGLCFGHIGLMRVFSKPVKNVYLCQNLCVVGTDFFQEEFHLVEGLPSFLNMGLDKCFANLNGLLSGFSAL